MGAGKLIRPRFVELGWRLATAAPVPPSERAAVDRLGAVFELLHTALLVHDDVIDRDMLRRGQPAVQDSATATAAGEPEDVLLGLSRHTGEEPDSDRILAMQRLKTAHYTVGAPLARRCPPGGR